MITAVVGAQYGDEGKGHVVDYLSCDADLVVRYQGGDNAGHTVVNEHGTFKLHLIPAGIFNSNTTCLIGTGTVVNLEALLEEMRSIEDAGINLGNLYLSERAQVVMPYHCALDGLEEEDRMSNKIGTTKKGIGPAYTDKAARSGIRIGDLLHPSWLYERLSSVLPRTNWVLKYFGGAAFDLDRLFRQYLELGRKLAPYIIDPLPLVKGMVEAGKNVLLEGQLGVMRDVDWGMYPFVTSSHPLSSYAAVGAGISPRLIDNILGVMKPYTTSVGGGPFPTELLDNDGESLRKIGAEYGATTGRPRRTGWFDAVAIRDAAWLNGFTSIALTKLDVLDTFSEIGLCTGYRLPNGKMLHHVPHTSILQTVKPVYEMWTGWNEPTTSARSWNDLPEKAQHYIRRLEELSMAPIAYISVGPERREIFGLNHEE